MDYDYVRRASESCGQVKKMLPLGGLKVLR